MQQVVLGALVRDGRVLLAHRSRHKRAYPGVWDLPGGEVEAGESERDALVRELSEELGVKVEPSAVSLLARVPGPSSGGVRISAWLVPRWRGTPANAAPDEHDDLRWFDLETLPDLPHAPIRAALARQARAGSRLASVKRAGPGGAGGAGPPTVRATGP